MKYQKFIFITVFLLTVLQLVRSSENNELVDGTDLNALFGKDNWVDPCDSFSKSQCGNGNQCTWMTNDGYFGFLRIFGMGKCVDAEYFPDNDDENIPEIDIYFIRHGESKWNHFLEDYSRVMMNPLTFRAGRNGTETNGTKEYLDAPLTDQGKADAKGAADFARANGFQAFNDDVLFYSSPLNRAAHTLAKVKEAIDKDNRQTITIHPGLREIAKDIDCKTHKYDAKTALEEYTSRMALAEGLKRESGHEGMIDWIPEGQTYLKTNYTRRTILQKHKDKKMDEIYADVFKSIYRRAMRENKSKVFIGGHSMIIRDVIAPVLTNNYGKNEKKTMKTIVYPKGSLWKALLKPNKLNNGAILKFKLKVKDGKIIFGEPEIIHKCLNKKNQG